MYPQLESLVWNKRRGRQLESLVWNKRRGRFNLVCDPSSGLSSSPRCSLDQILVVIKIVRVCCSFEVLLVVGGATIRPDQQLIRLIDRAVAVGNCISVASGHHACEQGRDKTLLERGNHGDGPFVEQYHGRTERCPLYNSCHS